MSTHSGESTGEESGIAEISIPASSFELGRLITDSFEVELERIVPLSDSLIPLIWIREGDETLFEESLRDHPESSTVRRLTSMNSEVLFEVHWSREVDGFFQPLLDHNIYLLEGSGRDDTWEFRLRYRDRSELTSFYEAVTANGVPVTLQKLYNPGPPPDRADVQLSEKNREAVELAYRRGYFRVPRQTTVAELGDALDISGSAFSKRLRNGVNTVIEVCLMERK